MKKPLRPVPKSEYWACACVKRDKNANLSKIKLHHPDRKRCPVCKCTKPEAA